MGTLCLMGSGVVICSVPAVSWPTKSQDLFESPVNKVTNEQFPRAICVYLVARLWGLVVCNKKSNQVLVQIPVACLNQDRRRFAVDSFFIRELLCPKRTVFDVWPQLRSKLECICEIFARISE